MTELVDAALQSVAARSAIAVPLLFGCGVLTSVGPCAAPRYVAVAALASTSRHPLRVVASFAAGLVGGYLCLGAAAGLLAALRLGSTWIYAGLALGLACGGLVTLLRRCDDHRCVRSRVPIGVGGALLIGAATVLVVSPCCTPVVAAIAGLTLVSGHPIDGVVFLTAFAIGHALLLLVAATLGARVRRGALRLAASPAPSVIAGTLMIALGAYFGVLA